MVERLKRWESPRKRGRNHKGKGGSARARQLRKQQKLLRKKLKGNSDNQQQNQDKRREINPPSIFLHLSGVILNPVYISPLKFKL